MNNTSLRCNSYHPSLFPFFVIHFNPSLFHRRISFFLKTLSTFTSYPHVHSSLRFYHWYAYMTNFFWIFFQHSKFSIHCYKNFGHRLFYDSVVHFSIHIISSCLYLTIQIHYRYQSCFSDIIFVIYKFWSPIFFRFCCPFSIHLNTNCMVFLMSSSRSLLPISCLY